MALQFEWLFGKRKTPEEIVKDERKKLRHEHRALETQIMRIAREEKTVASALRRSTDRQEQLVLARELVMSKRAVQRIRAQQAQIGSLILALQQTLANHRVGTALGRSAQVLVSMNRLLSVPHLSALMVDMSKEFCKAGLIDEAIDGAITWMEDDGDDSDAEAEVQHVLDEITMDAAARLLPTPARAGEENDDDTESVAILRERLQNLG